MNENCIVCKYSSLHGNKSYKDGPSTDSGYECRRRSPSVLGGYMSAAWTSWPIVKPNDWCGDFERRHGEGK